jgi:diaminohydroxyphosphoribosylaminopyrimidine deaminase/5-amino-6-(5-phosphoribosylamino)uracil reductase
MSVPHITLKLATSLDGRIATAAGESKWITGEEARAAAHRMRAQSDAVMIGAGTARADNPSLLARTEPPPPRQPARIVVSATLDMPTAGRLFEHLDASPLFVFTAKGADAARKAALAAAGATVIPAGSVDVDWPQALKQLAQLGLKRILAEGGGALAGGLIAAGVVQRIEWFRAPILLGGDGRPGLGPLALASLKDAPAWRRVALRELGPDLWESYERL